MIIDTEKLQETIIAYYANIAVTVDGMASYADAVVAMVRQSRCQDADEDAIRVIEEVARRHTL